MNHTARIEAQLRMGDLDGEDEDTDDTEGDGE